MKKRWALLLMATLVLAPLALEGCNKKEPEEKDYYSGPMQPKSEREKTVPPGGKGGKGGGRDTG